MGTTGAMPRWSSPILDRPHVALPIGQPYSRQHHRLNSPRRGGDYRGSGFCQLEWSQVSIQRWEIRLTKTSSPRTVPLSDAAVSIPRRITSPHVFWHCDGQRHTTVRQQFCRDRPTSGCAVPLPRSAAPFRINLPSGDRRYCRTAEVKPALIA
jgi:hypothetical protein